MMMLTIPRKHQLELLDQLKQDPLEIAESLHDLRRINRYLGGYIPILKTLTHLVQSIPKRETLRILDVATGSADIPVQIVKWARKQHRKIRITAVDIHPEVLRIARAYTEAYPEICIQTANALDLPFADRSYHVVICSLVIHHFEPAEAAIVMAEMNRVSRCGVIISDLERATPAYFWIYLLSRLFTKNKITRHDGPLSVQRAYQKNELAEIAQGVLEHFTIRQTAYYRQLLVSEKSCERSGEDKR
jgi:ubiquinone/menaquinone biosynthesis C-methylase UbiE